MSNIWDSAVDSVLGGLSVPPPPASPARATLARTVSEQSGVPEDVVDLDPESWKLRYQEQSNAKAIQSTPELQAYLLKNELNKKISRDDLVALKKAAEKARASLPTISPSKGDWRQLVFHAGQDPYELVPQAGSAILPDVPLPERFQPNLPVPGLERTGPGPSLPEPAAPEQGAFEIAGHAILRSLGIEPPAKGDTGGVIEEGFRQAFAEPLGLTAGGEAEKFWQTLGGGSFEFAARPATTLLDAVGRAFQGAGLSVSEGAARFTKLINDLTADPKFAGDPEAVRREAYNISQYMMTRFAEAPVPGVAKPPLPLTPRAFEFLKTAKEIQPVRPVRPIEAWARTFEYKALPSPEMVTPSQREAVKAVVDDARAAVAEAEAVKPGEPPPAPKGAVEVDAIANQAVLNSIVKSVQETATKGRSPSAIHDFAEEAVKDSSVSVPVEAVTALYAEKGVSPAPGDGVLGFTPDIVQQVDVAKATGGDVKIPLAGYLAHVDPSVHESLQGDLRVGDGLTVNEASTRVEEDQKLEKLREEQRVQREKQREQQKLVPSPEELVQPTPAQQQAAITRDITKPPRDYSRKNPPPTDRPIPDVSVLPELSFERKAALMTADLDARKAPDADYQAIFSAGAREATAKGNPKGYASWRDMALSIVEKAVSKIELTPAKAVEAAPAEPVRLFHGTNKVFEQLDTAVQPFEGDMVAPPGGEAIQAEVTEADFASRFSLSQSPGLGGEYAIMRDNRMVGFFTAQLDPADPTTIKVSTVDVPEAIDRPGTGDIRKLFRELQKDFPTATHIKGERIGGSRMGAVSPRTKIPTSVDMVRKTLHLEPLFQDAKAAGMTEPEFRAYSKNLQVHQAQVAEKKRATAERNARREHKELSKTERAKAEKEFDNRQVIQVESLMKDSGVKLDEKLVAKNTVPRGLTAPHGAAPDDIAGALGYNSGAELLRDLEGLHQDRGNLGPADYRKSVIDRAVEERVPEMPDFTDEIFSEPLSRVLYDDLRVMYRQTEGAEGMPPLALAELEARAKRRFDEMPIKEASNLSRWTKDVRENGRKAELALLSGDVPKAFRFKNQQLDAHLMAREANKFNREFAKPLGRALRAEERAAREAAKPATGEVSTEGEPPEESEETVVPPKPRWQSPTVLLERYNKKKPPKNISPEFVDQIQGILMQSSIPFGRNAGQLAKALEGKSLQEFVKEKNQQGADIAVADYLYDPRAMTPLSDMKVRDHRNLFNSIRSLDHAGREALRVQVGKERVRVEELAAQMILSLRQKPSRYKESTRDPGRERKSLTYWVDALNVRPEQMLQDMDEKDPLGAFTQAITIPIQKGKYWEERLIEWVAKRFDELPPLENATERLANVPFRNSLTRTENNVLGYTYPMQRLDAIMVAVQLGNETSTKAVVSTLLGGEDVFNGDPVRATQFVRDWIEGVLTPNDWKFVEGLWGIFKDIKPLVDEVYLRSSGVAPDTIEPVPWGEHGGGYFPIIHDPWAGEKASLIFRSPFETDYKRATTANGYTRERTGKFMPVRILDAYHLVPGIVRGMLHDIAMREPINQAWKMLTRPDVLEAINGHYGIEYTRQLDYWLRQIANPFNQNDAALGRVAQLMSGMRRNIIISNIALNINVLLSPNIGPIMKYLAVQGSGLSKLGGGEGVTSHLEIAGLSERAISELKAGRLLMNNELRQFAINNSEEIRHRMENIDRDLRDAFTSAMGTRSAVEWMRSDGARFLMLAPVAIERELMIIAFNEEFARAKHTGKTWFYPDEVRQYTDQQAIDAANALLRRYFGSHNAVDLPGIMRLGEMGKTFVSMFQGFQNAMYGNTRDVLVLGARSIRRAKKGEWKGARSDFSKLSANFWMFFLVTAGFGYLYNKKNIDEMLKKGHYGGAGAALLSQQLMSLVPGIREVGAYVTGYQTRLPPVSQVIVDVLRSGKLTWKEFVGKGKEPSRALQVGIQALSALIGVPGGQQLGRTAQYFWNVTTGQDEDRDFSEWLRGVMTGKGKK